MTLAGRVLIGRGRTAEIYEWDHGRALRLERPGVDRRIVERSRDALSAARRAGAPCPEAFEVVEVDGRAGLVMGRIDGPDMLNDFTSHPWRLVSSARTLAHLHAAIVRTPAPPGARSLRSDIEHRLDDEAVPRAIRDAALRVLADLPDGDRLVHGDFHPANVLLGDDGPVVIDWENLRAGDAVADHAKSTLLLRHADPPDPPRLLRGLIAGGRRMFARVYERTFRREVGVDASAFDRWRFVMAAARLADHIEPERPRLLRLLASPPPNLRQ